MSFLCPSLAPGLPLAGLLLAVAAGCARAAPETAAPDPRPDVRDTIVVLGRPELAAVSQADPGEISWTPTETGGDAGSVLFRNFRVGFETVEGPLNRGGMATLRIPTQYTAKAGTEVRVEQQVRFAVSKNEDSRVTVILALGGEPEIMTFPFGAAIDSPPTTVSVNRTIKLPSAFHNATFVVLVERLSSAAFGYLDFDSYDLIIRPER